MQNDAYEDAKEALFVEAGLVKKSKEVDQLK